MKRLPLLLLLAGAAAFVAGVIHLFHLRFAEGDIYPPYSSLRSDPLGVKALYQSVDQLISAQRNFQPLGKLGDGRFSTLFYLGLNAADLEFDPVQLRDLETFVTTGGRLVVSLYPFYRKPPAAGRPATFPRDPLLTNQPPASTPPTRLQPSQTDANRTVGLEKRWGFQIGHASLRRVDSGPSVWVQARFDSAVKPGLPDRIEWHSSLILTNLDPAWRVLYARPGSAAVVVERDFDHGTVVLVTDSYLFSNEALQQEPQPGLLTWFVGPARRVLFEETHFGATENPGVANLLRKYRLHGFFAALLLLAALFVWKNAASLIPVAAADATLLPTAIQGREASAGLVNLLRRNVPAAGVLGLCLEEWKKSCRHERGAKRLEEIQAAIDEPTQGPIKDQDPVQAYRRISERLARKF